MHHKSMNHIYRLVWSQVSNAWVAVAETTRGRGKGASRKLKLMAAAALSLSTAFSPLAQAGPAGGQVVTGAGSISQSGATTTIQQSSQNLSLTWKSFNIAPQETVNFVQPSASAIAVNRIFDTNGTQILGRLNANGQVYLINPNGILFGQGAQVNVGALVASTLDFNDTSLNSATRAFSGTGSGSIVNQGSLNAAQGGYVALLGNSVSNQGTITAPQGSVALGAGSAATLTFQNNSLVQMQVDQSVLNSLAENGGLINADGGMVIMTAGAKNALLASVVNNTGVIEARTVEHHEGSIILLAGMAAGTVNVGGTLDASAPNGGNGGFIDTSAAHVKIDPNVKITTAAAQGKTGTWLIDPVDYHIAATGGNITGTLLSSSLGSNNVTILSSSGTTAGAGNINVNDAVTWSANTQLTLTASNHINVNANITATGATAGIALNPNTANGADAASGTGTLNLAKGVSINLPNVAPTSTATTGLSIGGTLYTVINTLGTAGSTGTNLQGITGATNYALGSNIDASATSSWNAGAGFAPISGFTGSFNGLGHSISNLFINLPNIDNVGLFGSTTGTLTNVGLVNANVTGANFVGGLVGYSHLTAGKNFSNNYSQGGNVHGTGTHAGGLVGWITLDAGDFSNNYATGNVVGPGGTHHGGLVGWITITTGDFKNNYATGNVTGGTTHQGGLVGWSTITTGNFSNNYARGNVDGSTYVGGLAGWSTITAGNFSNSYSKGTVAGTTPIGGLLGYNLVTAGTFSSSYWDTQTSGLITSAAGTGKTTAEMQTQSTFAGWDFTNTWYMPANGYPLLQALFARLTVTANNVSQAYNGSPYSLSSSGLTYSLTPDMTLLGTLTNTGNSQGVKNVGAYVIQPLYANATGYMITYVNGALTITPYAVSLTGTRVYDGSANVASGIFTLGTLVGSETLSLSGSGTLASRNVGTGKSVTLGNLALANGTGLASNYSLTGGSQTANITARAITLTAPSVTKTYDGGLTYTPLAGNLTALATPLLGGDTVSAASIAYTNANAGAGNKTVSLNAATISDGNSGNNYLVTLAGNTSSSISRRPIILTADAKTKVYGNTDPALSFKAEANGTNRGLVTGDKFTGALTRSAGENVGSYSINASALANGNYLISTNNGALTISQRPIILTADTKAKVYGNTDPALTYTAEVNSTGRGLVGADKFTGALTRSTGENVGRYTINAAALANGNYLISSNNGALIISQRPITLTADAKAKVYGNTDPALSFTAEAKSANRGLVNGDKFTGVLTRIAGENVGNYSISAQALANRNYLISVKNGALTISQRPITLTVDAKAKVYGNTDPALTFKAEAKGTNRGLVNGDKFTGVLTRSAGENVGNYSISAQTLANRNYLISVKNGALTISQRPITLTVDAKTKIHGNTDPALTFTAEAKSTGRGLVPGDRFTGMLTRTAGENVGSYSINAKALANGNYLISVKNGALTIRRPPPP